MWRHEQKLVNLTESSGVMLNHFQLTSKCLDSFLEERIDKPNLIIICMLVIFFIHKVVPYLYKQFSENNLTTIGLKVLMSTPVVGYFINKVLVKQLEGSLPILEKVMYSKRTEVNEHIPNLPWKVDRIKEQVNFWHEDHKKEYATGLHSGTIYHRESEEFNELIQKAMSLFTDTTISDPQNFKGVAKMNSDIINITKRLFNGDEETTGTTTSGGSESIISALFAYKRWAKAERGVTKPNLVGFSTLHAAFGKGCFILNIEFKEVQVDKNGVGDLNELIKHIDDNTIAIAGSACNYAHGSHDALAEMGKIALEHGIGFHIDNCLGGFINCFMEKVKGDMTPFDFRIPGVTTISVDTHKYAYGPKGLSVLLIRPKSLFDYLRYTSVDGLIHGGKSFFTINGTG